MSAKHLQEDRSNECGIKNIQATFDFSSLQLGPPVRAALRRAIRAHFGHQGIKQQKKAFYSIGLLAKSLNSAGWAAGDKLPADVVMIFARWLDASNLGTIAQNYLSSVTNLLRWCHRNVPNVLTKGTSFDVPIIRYSNVVRGTPIEEESLKKILRACYEEIECAEERFARGQGIRALDGEPSDSSEQAKIRELLAVGKGELPLRSELVRIDYSLYGNTLPLGGLRGISERLWLSPTSLFPFYLAILIQASGNPEAVAFMDRSCVIDHPLRSDLEWLSWRKPRSAKEQRIEFPRGRPWSATNIARRLMALNDELVPFAKSPFQNSLFICRIHHDRSVAVPWNLMDRDLKAFIKRHNLPNFQLKQIRRAGANLHHVAAGSIEVPKRRLNHTSARTTALYSSPSMLADQHDITIRRFQGKLVKLALESSSPLALTDTNSQPPFAGADTTFGFRCANPLGGISPESKVGELCKHFTGCATCPGAIIPLDYPPVVARLLESLTALEDAKKRSVQERWVDRYLLIYESTRLILTREILPAIHPNVLETARSLVQSCLVPYLE
jgi:hypothetical protein